MSDNKMGMGDLGGHLGSLLKEAEKMQTNMKRAQEELSAVKVEGKAGGGMVTVVMNGRHEVSKVTIAKALMEEAKDMVEDLLAAAINSAVGQVETISKAKITELTAGLNIPTGFMEGEGDEGQ